jgi:hypothetical protein
MVDAHDAQFFALACSYHVESRWAVMDLEARHGDVVLRGLSCVDQVAVRVAGNWVQLLRVDFGCFYLFGLASLLCFGDGHGPFDGGGLALRGAGGAFSSFGLPCGFVALRLGFAR